MLSEDYLDDFEDDGSEIEDVYCNVFDCKGNSSITTATTLANLPQKKEIKNNIQQSPQIMKLEISNFKESQQTDKITEQSKLNQSYLCKNDDQKQNLNKLFTPEIRSYSKHEEKIKNTSQVKKNIGVTSIYQNVSFQQSFMNNKPIQASYQQKFQSNIYQKDQEQKPKNIFAPERSVKPQISNTKETSPIKKNKAEEQIRGFSLGPKVSSKVIEAKSPVKLEYVKKDYLPKKDKQQFRKLNHSGPSTRIPSDRQLQNRPQSNKETETSETLSSYLNVSAQCWCVIDGDTGQFLLGKNEHMQREVASITKVMTCYVALQLANRLNLRLDNTFFEVSNYGASIGGTSANLCSGDQLSLKDLLYGLMLPSGNDAALTIAENFVDFIEDDELTQEDKEMLTQFRRRRNAGPCQQTDFFISQMNLQGLFMLTLTVTKKIGYDFQKVQQMKKINHQLLILQHYVIMQSKIKHLLRLFKLNYIFQKLLMKMQQFFYTNQKGFSKEVFWDNTNKLLYKGFCGIKTGITQKSGPCVVEQYKDDKLNLIIVLLNSKTTEERWADAFRILHWFRENQNTK